MPKGSEPMICPKSGDAMNRHADRVREPRTREEIRMVDPDLGGLVEEMFACPGCGWVESRPAKLRRRRTLRGRRG